MEAEREQITTDLEELERVVATLASQRNVAHIQSRIITLRARLQQLDALQRTAAESAPTAESAPDAASAAAIEPAPTAAAQPALRSAAPPSTSDALLYRPLERFAWDQEHDKVSIMVTEGMEGVGSLPEEAVTCDFTPHSFDLKIRGLRSGHVRLLRDNLAHPIDPARSRVRVRPNRVSITLRKATGGMWLEGLQAKSAPKAPKKPETDNPADSLMGIMKNLYEEGDEEMKRTIAKAWTESREKTARGEM